jgi:hypothetical protein
MTDVWILVADRARARLFSLGKDVLRMIESRTLSIRRLPVTREHAPPPRVTTLLT